MTAPKPDGGVGSGWDPSQASGTGTSSSAQTTLWDLNGLDEKNPITVQYGSQEAARRVPQQLDPYDREAARDAATKPSLALPGDLVKQPITLYGTDPKAYLAFQQALYAGGFYGSTSAASIPWGSDPTGSTYDAWKRVLAAAQQAQSAGLNVTPDQILQRGIQGRKDTAGADPKRPLVIQTTDPAVLRGLVQQAAQASLGRNLGAAEVEEFVRSFQEQEAAYSRRAYAAGEDESGKTFSLTQPNAGAQATEFVDDGHEDEAGGNRSADYIGVLERMLGGS